MKVSSPGYLPLCGKSHGDQKRFRDEAIAKLKAAICDFRSDLM